MGTASVHHSKKGQTLARYDKYDPNVGGFRAPLAADLTATEKTGNGNPLPVGLDVNGRVVAGAGAAGSVSGTVGLLCTTRDMKAGDVVDVMNFGEIVEMAGTVAGTRYAALANGTIGAPGAGLLNVGWTVEATRLVVRTGGGYA